MQRYKIWAKDEYSSVGMFIANDEELNNVEEDEAGSFTSDEILRTIEYIVDHVEQRTEFRIIPITIS